jgi:hypothetical protein
MGVNSCGTTLIDNGAFNNIGAISWDTTAKTAGFTAVAGNGYFVNTTSGQITVTLPSSPTAGDAVAIADYANTADTNKIIIDPNGNNIQGSASNFNLNTEGGTILLIYVDATQGWLSVDSAVASDILTTGPLFITATGGTITTSGDYKIHTFTGPGSFTVTNTGNAPTNPLGGPTSVDYLVVAGGGAGGISQGGGGGAGGYRTSYPSPAGTIPVSATSYPITVGAGGSGASSPPLTGANGSNSIFSSITSAGGGGGGSSPTSTANTGGSGGGGGANVANNNGAAGNTPPVSPPQGNPGGNGIFPGTGGGGGASAAGSNAPGNGGAGSPNSITGSAVTYAGGGGGSNYSTTGGTGGAGGGGNGGPAGTNGSPGTVNTGGGGGGRAPFSIVVQQDQAVQELLLLDTNINKINVFTN